jgi:hypothetical protein
LIDIKFYIDILYGKNYNKWEWFNN